jgi:type IV pilus assembly protein PilQ
MLSRKLIFYSAAAIFSLVIFSGCAQTKANIKEDNALAVGNSSAAVIQAIKVSSDASQIEILTDKPLSYTYYKTIEPPKLVIDIAQADPGSVTKSLEVNTGNIKRIELVKHEFTGGFLSRIEIFPIKELGDFTVTTDSVDKGKLLVTFAKSPGEEQQATEAKGEIKPAIVPEVANKPKEPQLPAEANVTKEEVKPPATVEAAANPATQQAQSGITEENKDAQPAPGAVSDSTKEEKQPAGELNKEAPPNVELKATPVVQQKLVKAVAASDEGIEITVNGGIDVFSTFKLTKPDRIVLDIPGVKSGIVAKSVAINKFGVGLARLGSYPDKVRIVLDAAKDSFPAYRVIKSANGLQVLFSEAPVVSAEKVEKEPVREASVPVTETKKAQPTGPVSDIKNEEKQTPDGINKEGKPADKSETAAVPPAKMLNTIAASDEGIEITVNGGIDTYSVFKLAKPDRIVLDMPGVKSGVPATPITINKFGIGDARLGIYPDKVRIVLDAEKDSIPSYKVIKSANGLRVLFVVASANPVEKVEKEPAKEAAESSIETGKAIKPAVSAIEAIDFSIVGEYSQIALKVGGACNVGKMSHVANGLAFTIHNCQVPIKFQRMIDTSAFPSVVRKIIPYQIKVKKGYDVRILVKLRQKVAESNLKTEGNTIYWNIKNPEIAKTQTVASKLAKEQPETPFVPEVAQREKAQPSREIETAQNKQLAATLKPGEKKVYTGRRVSLEFSDADIRKILQLIAEVSNLNFLIGDDVSGTLSIKLVNVPWDQALEVILDSKGLEKRQEGNIMYIKPKGKFKTEEQEESEALQEHERRMELKTQLFEVNFASIDDIAAQFEKLKSDRGSISKDSRTNRVIVTDISDRLEKMSRLLKALDLPEKQVMIEARIVEATTTFTQDIGVQWGLHYRDGSASIMGVNSLDVGLGGIVTTPPTSGTFSGTSSTTAGGAAGISFGKLTSNVQLDLVLSAAATVGLVKVISSPKVITLNNKAAKISQGQSIPYQTTSAEGTQTQFVEAALTLEVTPHVANDGSISMKIKASNNSAGSSVNGAPPPINKKEATTEVQVMNGETTVIGGIYQDSDSDSDSGVPFLKDIPLLGWLFKSNSKSKTKTELLIFITPRIVS